MTGAELKAIREALERTPTEFGMDLGYSEKSAQGAVSRLETGARPIGLRTARLAEMLFLHGIPAAWRY